MGQLDGSNRPGQLGDTGIIVLNTCKPMEGKCNCAALVLESVSSTTESSPRETFFIPERAPRRHGRKFSERKTSKSNKELKKSLVKPKQKYRRHQGRVRKEESLEEVTTTINPTTEKTVYTRRVRNKNRKLRIRKRI